MTEKELPETPELDEPGEGGVDETAPEDGVRDGDIGEAEPEAPEA